MNSYLQKIRTLFFFSFMLSLGVHVSYSQVTNGTVNYQLKAQSYWSNMNNDWYPDNDDNEISLWIGTDGNSGGTKTLNNVGDGSMTCTSPNTNVAYWQCHASCNRNDVDRSIYVATGVTASSSMSFTLNALCWESDNNTWTCSNVSGDDYVHAMNYAVNFKNGEANATNFPANSFSFYHGSNTTKDGWINGSWSVTSGSRNSDVRIKTIWRYTNGYDCNNPLNFGTLTVGAAALTHINTNRGNPGGADVNMYYNNVLGNAAPDVYYTFTISTDATVVISTVSASTNYDSYLRLYNSDCSTQIAVNDNFSGTQAQITQYLCAGTYKILVEGAGSATGNFLLSVSANSTTPAVPSTPAAGTFGTNQWNVYGYNGGNLDLTGSVYKGYYIETALSFNTTTKWSSAQSASYAPGWNGNCVNLDNHVVVSKRQGFPCDIYQLDVPSHDDDQRVYIDGALVWSHEPGCCDAHTNIWTGYLTSTSTIEVRHIDGAGGSNQALNFTVVTSALNGGTIAGITNGANVCQGTDPGAFTSSANASGGTIGITNGSPAAHVYQWQRATDAGFTTGLTNVGTNATTYDPDNSLTGGTYYFRRRVTDACGTVAYSNTIQIIVIQTLAAPTSIAATAQVCAISGYQANWNAIINATKYYIDIDNNSDFSSPEVNNLDVGNVTSYYIDFPAGVTYYYRVRAYNNTCNLTSGNSNTITATIPAINNDYIANAKYLGVLNAAGTTLSSGWDNNIGSTQETGETLHPDNESSNETDWLYFTTGSTPPSTVYITGEESDWLDLDWRLYKLNDNSYVFPRCGVNWSKLTYIIDGDGDQNVDACTGCLGGIFATSNREVSCLEANSTYYIVINGFLNDDGDLACGSCDQDQGNYKIDLDPYNTVSAPNNLCDAATDLGTLNAGSSITKNNFSNYCASRETNEPNSSSSDETVWYKFTTSSTRTNRIDVDVDAIGGTGTGGACVAGEIVAAWVRIYEQTGTPCPTNFGALTQIGSNNDPTGVTEDHWYFECMKPNTTYWIQVETGGLATCDKANFNVTISNPTYAFPGNDLLCNVSSVSTYDIGTAATVAANVGSVNNISKTGTNINGTNCFDPNPTWGGVCAASFNNDNDYGVWYKLPAATNRKDILIKGVTTGSGDLTDLQYALYEASAPTNCLNPGATLISGSYYGSLAWNSVAGLCASADEDHIYTCLDPAKDYYLMVDGNSQVISCGTGNFTLNTYYPKEGGVTQCTAEPISAASMLPNWTGTHKIALAANFCGNPSPSPAHPIAPWNYEKPVWFKFVAPASGSVNIEVQSDETDLGDEIRPRFWVFEENIMNNCNTLNYTNLDQKDPDDFLNAGDINLTNEKLDVRCLTPGRTYYVVVDGNTTITEVCGAGTKVGFFSITLKDLNAPTRKNDTICGATPGRVSGDPYYFVPSPDWKTVNKEAELNINNVDNYCHVIGNNASEPDPIAFGATDWASTNTERGTWFSFTAPPSGKVEIELNNISTFSDQINAQISVFRIKSGKTCRDVQSDPNINNPSTSTLEFYGSSNDAYVSSGADEDLTVSCLMPDSLYYIYVVGVNQGASGLVPDLATGQFNIAVRSYPQDPPAKNDNKCNPIYLGQPANTTLGSGNAGYINAQSCGNFNRNMSIPAGAPTLGTNGVTLTKPTNNHGGVLPISSPPGGNEVVLSCSPNPGCIDDMSAGDDYDRTEYPFNNFCASAVGDSTPANWGAIFGAVNAKPRKSVWFMFKAPDDLDGNGEEAVEIELNQELISLNPNRDAIDLRGAVFESSDNTCNGNFYDIKSEYDAGNFDETFKVTCLEPNRFYWLMVDGSSINDEGYFGIKISRVAPDPRPANDYICNAYTLSNSFFTGAAVGRTKDTNICARITRTAIDPTSENDPTGFDLDHTVWYKFTTPTAVGDYAVKVDVNGWGPVSITSPFGYSDKMDPQIAIFESQDGSCNWGGTNGTNMIEIASEYDILPFTESMIGYCLQPNKTYYVMVDGSALNSQGFFDISIDDYTPITPFPSGPLNYDLFANAVTLSVPSSVGAGGKTLSALAHNYCSGTEAGEPDSWTLYDIDNTVWWKFTVPTTGIYNNQHVDMTLRLLSDPGGTKNDGINLLGAVYELNGTPSFPNLTNIATGTNILLYDEDITLTCLTPGKTYFLQVDGYSGPYNIFRAQGQGYYKVELETTTLTPNQGNDSVCGALEILVNNTLHPASGTYNNICKTLQVNENLPWTNADSKTVWFKFIPPASGNVTIDLQSQSGDNIGAQLAVYQSLIPVASSTCPAIDQLVLAGKEYDPLAAGETMTIKCLDNQYWHYIQVNSENIGIWREGTFKIKIQNIGGTTNPPNNDNICNARDFGNITNANGTGAFAIVGDSNKCASIQVNEPNTVSNPSSSIQRSVWYKFTAPTSGRARITLHDQDGYLSGIDPEMKLYEGTLSGCPSASPTFGSFVELESAYNPLPNFPSSTTGDEVIEYECFIPGQVYYIQVDGTTVGGPQGFFDIKIEDMLPNYAASPKKPANDEPANATTLTVNQEECPVPLAATLAGIAVSGDRLQGNGTWTTGNYKKPTITKKDLVGTCNTTNNCGDIWYKFTMPNDACMLGSVVAIQGYSNQAAVGSQYHNDLKVIAYRGAPGSLTPIDCGNTDDNALTLDYFHFEITGTAGDTIYLQVFDQNYNDQDNDDEEDFFICVGKRYGLDKCQNLANVPFMEYEKDYCWNTEGASGEAISSAYGEANNNSDITENSAYFKFKFTDNPCDSLRISIWQPSSSPFLNTTTGCDVANKITLSVYREDDALCDGTINSALISKSYTPACPSGGAAINDVISFTIGAGVLDTNKVYVIQIDGEGQNVNGYVNNGFIRIDTLQRCVNVVAVTYNDTSTGYWKCVDGWRYYHDRNNVIIFALHPNGNNFEGTAKIRYKSTYDEATSCAAQMAEYSMRRIWDYQITSGTLDPAKPVKVRFYYLAPEKTAIINAANAFKASCGGYYEPFEWFKTSGGIQYIPTNPAQINPARITAGYSETACLGSPLFGSTNGCNYLTALDNQYSCNGVLYVELGAIVNFSGGTGAAGVGPWQNTSPLPVELTSFTGYNDGNKNVLNWTTASEINTAKFEVERADNLSGPFSYVGERPAAGNSAQPLNYTLDDLNPLLGHNYYRLKMIDLDGSFKYSNVIMINVDDISYDDAITSVYPNPTDHTIFIDYQSSAASKVNITVYNAIGQEMLYQKTAVAKGTQTLHLDVSAFADGVYIIQIQDVSSGKMMQSKFIKE